MWLKWFPWKIILKQVAQAQGFLDPILLLSRFNQFAQPSEVWAPVELMRAGAIFHARGLINSQVIQHNLDWVWPYWVERQFDPVDRSFIPRAFSVTHINLTHRNWTAVGLPNLSDLPVIDPRGLVMPFFDSWSIDAWIILHDNQQIIPSRMQDAHQQLIFNSNLQLVTTLKQNALTLTTRTEVLLNNGIPYCQISVDAQVPSDGLLIVAIRPYNPEGISFIHEISLLRSGNGWSTDGNRFVFLDKKPSFYRFSNFLHGDVYHWIHSATPPTQKEIVCNVGLATALAAYECSVDSPQKVTVKIPLDNKKNRRLFPIDTSVDTLWKQNLTGAAECVFPFKKFDQLYASALRSLIIHTPEESYAGPFIYKRFWFRDAAFIIKALLLAGLPQRAYRIISTFFNRQTDDGYFLSQEGEWDSTGQALWAMNQYLQMTDSRNCKEWYSAVCSACEWIIKKRISKSSSPQTDGLFPPGFSAEHLGPNDYYYWDNFWGIAGLQAAVSMLSRWGKKELLPALSNQIENWFKSIDISLSTTAGERRRPIMPASPNRRPDSGSVGSLAAGYPLQLWSPDDERLLLTAEYLFENCCIDNAFYHDISHSGINPYLTLHIAEVLLRASNPRFCDLVETIGGLSSQTGQWPEAIHPQLKTGCMGDGQHIWAAAEWMTIIRNCFIREEGADLILCQGILDKMFLNSKKFSFGFAPTKFGPVKCSVSKQKGNLRVEWSGKWFDSEPQIVVKIPGTEPFFAEKGQTQYEFPYKGKE